MTTSISEMEKTYVSTTKQRIEGSRFDWTMIAACTWLLTGGYLDAWAHNHIPSLETFFNPWHGVLYSGLLVVAMVMGSVLVINHARGDSWQQAVPAGYELSLLGIFGFAIGGVGDMFWHILFGFERNIDAELSPTHLMLMISLGLIMAGPLRAAWRRSKTTFKAQGVASPPLKLFSHPDRNSGESISISTKSLESYDVRWYRASGSSTTRNSQSYSHRRG